MKYIARFTAAAAIGLLSACATSVAIKDLEKDKLGHLRTNFGVSEIPSGIASAIANETPATEKFAQINFKMRMDYEGKSASSGYDFDVTILNAGKGVRQEVWESSNNGIAHVSELRLTHLGLMPIKVQYGYHGASRTTESSTTKSVSVVRPGIAKPTEGATYEFEYKLGGPIQIVNLFTSTHRCTAGKNYPASTIHANLAGNAIDLECEVGADGKTRSKNTLTFFHEYGFAIRKSFANSESKSVYRVLSATIA
jgi:hypothetical protein